MKAIDEGRRRFLAVFSSMGLSGTLLPGVLWAQAQQTPAISIETLQSALALSGLSFSESDQKAMLQSVNQNLARFEAVRKLQIPNDVSPPYHFSALTPGMKVQRLRQPLRFSASNAKRPANLEDVAFWPVTDLAHLIRTKQVNSLELTKMYLDRLHRYNPSLNCVVTFLDDLALAQAKRADADLAAGKYRGPLHGVPWGAKDIIAVKGYKTTWGSGAYKDQVIDHDASVVEILREAGAVLLAKLTTGELAGGDRWFGGQTKNPWRTQEGSAGSSAGPASATAAGLVGFGIGSETAGSILGPSSRCGVTGLRPTFGRISRHGVMALSWTQDRLGPLCRYAEDCAMVMSVIAKPDDRDMSVSEIPFNWDARLDIRKVRVGYLKAAFEESRDPKLKENDDKTFETLRALGVSLVPVSLPDWNLDNANFGVESGAFFDELVRSGRDKEMTNPGRANGFRSSRVVPAVEYLQAQRARMMMMMKLAEATAHVDIYVAPAANSGPAAITSDGSAPGAAAEELAPRRQTPTARHSNMANLACYPAVAVPNGFTPRGTPSSISFFARPFGESVLLALVKAYQDTAGFHRLHPKLET